ncbi:hypothetical protein [Achromobacter sp. NCFB-sbj8-Ac1-l]|jgi:hypothetical protein|uniref:hypothetical protein n=1 Tax=unclassified Achromobacter TaxID=2626865 RepID=UPI004046C6EA
MAAAPINEGECGAARDARKYGFHGLIVELSAAAHAKYPRENARIIAGDFAPGRPSPDHRFTLRPQKIGTHYFKIKKSPRS